MIDQVVPFLWYTYIFLQLQLTILFANKKAILLLFQFMTLSIFLTPQSTPFTKKRCLCAWIYEKHLIFALMIHRRRYDLKNVEKISRIKALKLSDYQIIRKNIVWSN